MNKILIALCLVLSTACYADEVDDENLIPLYRYYSCIHIMGAEKNKSAFTNKDWESLIAMNKTQMDYLRAQYSETELKVLSRRANAASLVAGNPHTVATCQEWIR